MRGTTPATTERFKMIPTNDNMISDFQRNALLDLYSAEEIDLKLNKPNGKAKMLYYATVIAFNNVDVVTTSNHFNVSVAQIWFWRRNSIRNLAIKASIAAKAERHAANKEPMLMMAA